VQIFAESKGQIWERPLPGLHSQDWPAGSADTSVMRGALPEIPAEICSAEDPFCREPKTETALSYPSKNPVNGAARSTRHGSRFYA